MIAKDARGTKTGEKVEGFLRFDKGNALDEFGIPCERSALGAAIHTRDSRRNRGPARFLTLMQVNVSNSRRNNSGTRPT